MSPVTVRAESASVSNRDSSPWRQRRDPLWRGDSRDGLTRPVPNANRSIVRHILFFGWRGCDTPYHSTSESRENAKYFAGELAAFSPDFVSRAADNAVHTYPELNFCDFYAAPARVTQLGLVCLSDAGSSLR